MSTQPTCSFRQMINYSLRLEELLEAQLLPRHTIGPQDVTKYVVPRLLGERQEFAFRTPCEPPQYGGYPEQRCAK